MVLTCNWKNWNFDAHLSSFPFVIVGDISSWDNTLTFMVYVLSSFSISGNILTFIYIGVPHGLTMKISHRNLKLLVNLTLKQMTLKCVLKKNWFTVIS